MYQLNRVKVIFMLSVAILVNTLAYKIQITEFSKEAGVYVVVVTILTLLAAFIAKFIAKFVLKITSVRKFILGTKYVEGHWLMLTSPAKNDPGSMLLNNGVTHMYFDDDTNEFCVTTSRFNEDGKEYTTNSKAASILTSGSRVQYLNYFELGGSKYDSRSGFSDGIFYLSNSFWKRPYKLHAKIAIQEEALTRTQSAIRIPDKYVKNFQKIYGRDWHLDYLKLVNKVETATSKIEQDEALSEFNEGSSLQIINHLKFLKRKFIKDED